MYLVQKFQGVNQKRSDKKALTLDYFIQLDKDLSKTLCNLCGGVFLLDIADFFSWPNNLLKDFELYTKGHSLLDEKRFM